MTDQLSSGRAHPGTSHRLIDASRFQSEQPEQSLPDSTQQMLTKCNSVLMNAAHEVARGAEYGQVSPFRGGSRNGCRHRNSDTRTGTGGVVIAKMYTGANSTHRLHACCQEREKSTPLLTGGGSNTLLPESATTAGRRSNPTFFAGFSHSKSHQ